jgi:EpsI family protein
MKSENSDRRPIVAAMAATVMMLVSGAAFHTLAARVRGSMTGLPIAPEVLEGFPMQIGDWTGQKVPLDETIVEKTDSDAYINRQYSRHNGRESVVFYLAYGSTWEMMYHRPEVCYPGNGWTLVDRSVMDLQVHNGMNLQCSIFRFSRSELETREVVVLYYCLADGRAYSNISLLRSRVWGVLAAVDHFAQVQIVASSRGALPPDAMIEIVSDFAVESASSIAELFVDAAEDRHSDEERARASAVYEGKESD